jgi:adenylyltransferase/sulfurtransferase
MPCAGIIRRNEAAGRAATTPIIASIIGAVEVQEALKLIHKEQLAAGELTSLCGKMFCYEGQHLTTRCVIFKGYDDDCAVHEQWQPVIKTTITTANTVADTLLQLQQLPNDNAPQICLNDSFVDMVELRATGEQTEVMKPGRAVNDYIEQHTTLRGRMLSELYQHEYHTLDSTFPYQQLTLADVGIPAWDVLHVNTAAGERYIEMDKQ